MPRRLTALLLCVLLLAACERTTQPERAIDAAWHREAMAKLLEHWLQVSPNPSGLFRTAISRDWKAEGGQGPARLELTMQGRMIYSMAMGYELTRDPRYLQAARRGTDFLLEHFHDPVQGGFFNVVSEDGQVVADRKRAYGQAFALLALSHMARITGEARYRQAAQQAWQEISGGMRDAQGGLVEVTTRSFVPESKNRTQNPVMHMFEALLALGQVTDDPGVKKDTRALGDFVVNRLMQGLPDGSAYIPEWYDEGWKPLPTHEAGGYVEVGHQFEWVHLLYSAQAQGVSDIYGPVAERLLLYALRQGYDEIDGGAFERIYSDGMERGKVYWQQLECLHGLIAAAGAEPRPDLWRRMDQTLGLVRAQFMDSQHGGWWDRACPRGGCDGKQPEPYHMASLHAAALKAAGAASAPRAR
ncbi:MAG: AGE family epimerase/isomerase [Paucibacter sp.]|nr:AGE family epimerase/isomerase [Roseateles sp.]